MVREEWWPLKWDPPNSTAWFFITPWLTFPSSIGSFSTQHKMSARLKSGCHFWDYKSETIVTCKTKKVMKHQTFSKCSFWSNHQLSTASVIFFWGVISNHPIHWDWLANLFDHFQWSKTPKILDNTLAKADSMAPVVLFLTSDTKSMLP